MPKYRYHYRPEEAEIPKVKIGIYEEAGEIMLVLPGNRVVAYDKMSKEEAKKEISDKFRKKGYTVEWQAVDENFRDMMREPGRKRPPTQKLFSLINEMVKVADLMDEEGMTDKADKIDKMVFKIAESAKDGEEIPEDIIKEYPKFFNK